MSGWFKITLVTDSKGPKKPVFKGYFWVSNSSNRVALVYEGYNFNKNLIYIPNLPTISTYIPPPHGEYGEFEATSNGVLKKDNVFYYDYYGKQWYYFDWYGLLLTSSTVSGPNKLVRLHLLNDADPASTKQKCLFSIYSADGTKKLKSILVTPTIVPTDDPLNP